jgi:hypothetical protein
MATTSNQYGTHKMGDSPWLKPTLPLPFVKVRFAVAQRSLVMSGNSKTQGNGGTRSFTTLHLPAVDVVPPPPANI